MWNLKCIYGETHQKGIPKPNKPCKFIQYLIFVYCNENGEGKIKKKRLTKRLSKKLGLDITPFEFDKTTYINIRREYEFK